MIVSFVEHPVFDVAEGRAHVFDVVSRDSGFIIGGEFAMHEYCRCLLYKIFEIHNSQVRGFLNYQVDQILEPSVWLNSLEDLLELNLESFDGRRARLRVEKVLIVAELLLAELEKNRFLHPRAFDFKKVKHALKNYPSAKEQLVFLCELKAEYLQNKPAFIDPNEIAFDEKIRVEIEKIEELQCYLDEREGMLVKRDKSLSEPYLDNEDLLLLMKISKRTALRWRDTGVIPYTQIEGKVYYKLSDVEELLKRNYVKGL